MTDEQKRILELTTALGLALGALELIGLSPDDFNKDGVVYVIKKIKDALEHDDNPETKKYRETGI